MCCILWRGPAEARPRQEDDLEAAGGHRVVEGTEAAVAGQPLLDHIAGQGAPQPEGD